MLLLDASGGVLRAFRSSDRKGMSGIEFGAEWYPVVMTKLIEASDVIALLTPRSLERPWLLYELGVARGNRNASAFGVAFNVALANLSGPFQQLQNSAADEESLTKLLMQLLQRNPDATPRADAVRRQVSAFLERLPSLVEASSPPTAGDSNTNAKMFEEVKVMFAVVSTLLMARNVDERFTQDALRGDQWLARGSVIVNLLRTACTREEFRDSWTVYLNHFNDREFFPDGGVEVWQAFGDADGATILAAADAFATNLIRFPDGKPTKPEDVELFEYLRNGLAALRAWLSTGANASASDEVPLSSA